MNFEDINPLNIRLNKLSGNLLPMTNNDKVFPVAWRIYSAVLLLIEITHTSAMIPALTLVPFSVALESWVPAFVVLADASFLYSRLNLRRGLVCQFIRTMNGMIQEKQDATMKNILTSLMEPVQGPLKFYSIAGSACIVGWYSLNTVTVIGKEYFRYEDYRIPTVFSKQPFSIGIFIWGEIIGVLSTLFYFVRKVAVDTYMINMLLLMTAQYRYTATKLATLFQHGSFEDDHDESERRLRSEKDASIEMEMKTLCRHHIDVIRLTPVLKKLLSLNFSVIYMTNVFRFCFLGIMTILSLSTAPLVSAVVFVYIIGGILQLYMVCSSVHRLLETSIQITNKAFHEKWYEYGPYLKRMFSLMIISNNLEMKLYTFGKYNLTLPSFMMILNQSYSIALLFLRVR